jgi:hypothetical protein
MVQTQTLISARHEIASHLPDASVRQQTIQRGSVEHDQVFTGSKASVLDVRAFRLSLTESRPYRASSYRRCGSAWAVATSALIAFCGVRLWLYLATSLAKIISAANDEGLTADAFRNVVGQRIRDLKREQNPQLPLGMTSINGGAA